jgi:hypothetical protein
MNCWIIDSQSNSGPDYCWRSITVIIAPNDMSANEMYLDNEDYPKKKKYLKMKTNDLALLVYDEDPEEYFDNWQLQCNDVITYSNVLSTEASIKRLDIPMEGLNPIKFYKKTKEAVLELDRYYKEKIGQDSPYSFSNFEENFYEFLDEDEEYNYLIEGISIESLIGSMIKRLSI